MVNPQDHARSHGRRLRLVLVAQLTVPYLRFRGQYCHGLGRFKGQIAWNFRRSQEFCPGSCLGSQEPVFGHIKHRSVRLITVLITDQSYNNLCYLFSHFRVFDATTRKVVSRSSKCVLPVPEGSAIHKKEIRIFHDDTLQTFYRRLSFSPDGELIITPSGSAELNEESKPIHTTYVYTRYNTKQ